MPATAVNILNPRHIIVHMLAIYFLHRAFIYFACLMHVDLLGTLPDVDGAANLTGSNKFLFYVSMFAIAGSLTGFLISGLVGIIKKWFWLNTLLAFISFWLLNNFVFSKIGITSMIGEFGNKMGNLLLYYSVLMSIMLGLSMVLFFSNRARRYIEGYKKSETGDAAVSGTIS